MAEIEKGLPNTRTKLDVPSEEEIAQEVAVQEPEEQKGPIEVIPEEDGGVTLDFEPGAINVPGTESHFDNLADLLPDDVLEPIGNDMVQNYMDYKASRKDWEQSYTQGLDLLGFKYDNRTEPFQGARQAFDPFQAAGGGLAKQAGDRSGRPPEKGPNSQGLLSLMKRGMKI